MDKIEEISVYELPDTRKVQDAYDIRTVPVVSTGNLEVLICKINEIASVVNQITSQPERYNDIRRMKHENI